MIVETRSEAGIRKWCTRQEVAEDLTLLVTYTKCDNKYTTVTNQIVFKVIGHISVLVPR